MPQATLRCVRYARHISSQRNISAHPSAAACSQMRSRIVNRPEARRPNESSCCPPVVSP
ncbi:hypothetical protein OBBRIDRAFT_490883 [Obba rivulosa]|uniref:Uncharacterized protein n=1 Tax=Obba rivulosa TaxID=1052685 RepID=A0A8E2AKT4_9APHY|nr:hypothetical protein OBBRIDRAFT_490883 [Obba rivulosa]